MKKLEEIKKLCEKATPGPWDVLPALIEVIEKQRNELEHSARNMGIIHRSILKREYILTAAGKLEYEMEKALKEIDEFLEGIII